MRFWRKKINNNRRDLARELDHSIKEIKKLQVERQNLLTKLYTDDLTGVANRRAFDEKLPELVAIAHKNNEPLALMMADVDGLKRTNDKLGHGKGDELLGTVADALASAARDTDLVGRLGGDEFYCILPGFFPNEGQDDASLTENTLQRYEQTCNQVISKLKIPASLKVGVSFGIATLKKVEPADSLYKRADAAARHSKKLRYDSLSVDGVRFEDRRLEP